MLAASASDLSNERFVVTGMDLEQHWQIDCQLLVQRIDNLSATAPTGIEAGELPALVSVAEKCAIIYNTPNTGRTKACPDYRQLKTYLQQLSKHSTAADSKPATQCQAALP